MTCPDSWVPNGCQALGLVFRPGGPAPLLATQLTIQWTVLPWALQRPAPGR